MRLLDISQYQKRFFIEWKLNPQSISYNTPLIFEIVGNLNIEALNYALKTFINYYDEGCRSHFVEINGTIKQVINDHVDVKIEINDFGDQIENINEAKNRFIEKITSHLFDLTKPNLFKFGILNLKSEHWIVVLNFHHIISDGVTASYFINIVSDLYNSYIKNELTLNNFKLQSLEEYITYEKETYSVEQQKIDLNYWESLLTDAELCFDIPFKNVEKTNFPKFKSLYFDLDVNIAHQIKKLARDQNSSIFIVLAAIYSLLLLRYTNQQSIVLNYPVNMRPPGFREMTGCYVNNVLFKIEITHNQTFKELLDSLTQQRRETKQHQRCSLIDVVQHLREKKILKGKHFFNVDFFEAYLGLLSLNLHGLSVTSIQPIQVEILNDIGLAYQQTNETIKFKLEYKSELFNDKLIDDFIYQFKQSISHVARNIDIPLYGFSLVSEANYKRIINDWNATKIAFNLSHSVCSLFEAKAAQSPKNIAVQYLDQSLAYEDLNTKSNQLARYLKMKGVKIESVIGIYLERSIDLIIAILAVLKAGAAYIPLDPKYPEARISQIIRDSGLTLILTQSHLNHYLESNKLTAISLDTEWRNIQLQIMSNLPELSYLTRAAYVIYTSGSTGTPKGVVISHASLLNHNLFVQQHYEITDQDKVLQFSSINFDISIEEIFPTLISGATLVLYPDSEGLSIQTFQQLIKKEKITCVNLPTAFWHAWLAEVDQKSKMDFNSLKLVIVGGEQPHFSTLMRWNTLFGSGPKWINTYGPTEGTVIASTWKYFENLNDSEEKSIPIGKPIANCQLYITDAEFNAVPIGVTGELLIAGNNLARCYLNQPDLTAEKFIPNPFSNIPGERVYRTGDMARYRNDGTIEYIGRIDQQVKVRGYRIELSEIEIALLTHDSISEAVVVAHKQSDNSCRLIAYIVTFQHSKFDSVEIKKFLNQTLPEYMIPILFIHLANLPLNSNGKINKYALPTPDFNMDIGKSFVSANSQIEKQLVAIWKDCLNIEKISIEDNFFDLGGHSLLILKVHKKIEEILNTTFPVIYLFQYPTIKSLALYISTQYQNPDMDIKTKTNAQMQRMAFEKQRQLLKRRNTHDRS